MRDKTLLKIDALKKRVEPDILKEVAEIVVDVYRDGIDVGMVAARKETKQEISLLRRAARLIYNRRKMVSGSLEMAECDVICKEAGLDVWTWPL